MLSQTLKELRQLFRIPDYRCFWSAALQSHASRWIQHTYHLTNDRDLLEIEFFANVS